MTSSPDHDEAWRKLPSAVIADRIDDHIKDVVGVLQWEDLEDVVLVGHSMAA